VRQVFTSEQERLTTHAGAVALVTGAGGFIGGHLCRLLRASGWVVQSVSRRENGPEQAHRHHQVDLANAAATRRMVDAVRPDYVFHLASHVCALPDLEFVLPTFHSNLHSTVNLLHAVVDTSCRRFVIAGSQVEPEVRLANDVPNAPYAAAKWASSDYARMFHALYALPAVIARVFMVYGPEQNETKLIPYVIGAVLRGDPPRVTSGRRMADWIYVDDVALGLALIAVTPGIAGTTIDLGSGALVSTRELVERLCALLESKVPPVFGALPDRPMEPSFPARAVETDRLLGWRPGTSVDEGLTRTIQSHQRLLRLRGSPGGDLSWSR
jgi:UDP-glucose 4-epimerase